MSKVKRIVVCVFALVMLTLALCASVSAESYYDEHYYTVKTSSGTTVGTGTLDFGTNTERGAYASCTRTTTSYYDHAYCRLVSRSSSGSELNRDLGYNAYTAYCNIPVQYAGATVDLTLHIYKDNNGLVPSNSPVLNDTVAWYKY